MLHTSSFGYWDAGCPTVVVNLSQCRLLAHDIQPVVKALQIGWCDHLLLNEVRKMHEEGRSVIDVATWIEIPD